MLEMFDLKQQNQKIDQEIDEALSRHLPSITERTFVNTFFNIFLFDL